MWVELCTLWAATARVSSPSPWHPHSAFCLCEFDFFPHISAMPVLLLSSAYFRIILFFFFRFYVFMFIFREREGREKERERNIDVAEILCPQLEIWPSSQACALTGNQPATLCFTGRHSVQWATPSRALPFKGWIMFHCMCIHFLYPSVEGHLSCFHLRSSKLLWITLQWI